MLGFALAWAIRFHVRRGRDLLLLVIVISSIGSYLARLYAWRSILGGNGIVNYTLQRVGVIDQPLDWLIFNRFAVILTLTNVFLPFAFLPIYANLLACGQKYSKPGASSARARSRTSAESFSRSPAPASS